MAPPLLILKDIALGFGGAALLDGVELSVGAGERVCLVGRNGSGKSTLLKIAAGLVEPDGGTRFVQPGATLRYLPQEPDLAGSASALDYVQAGLAPGDDAHRARYLLERLGLAGDEAPSRLSGGEARRAALARALAPAPDILLLDEPTNHLDVTAIEWLESELASADAALVLVSHDRRFLETLSRATVWLDRGRTRRIDVGFAGFEAWRDDALAQEVRDRHKLDRRIAAEADWLRYGVTARRKRNTRRLAELRAMRERRRTERRATGQATMTAARAGLSGKSVVEARGIAKSYDGRAIVREFSILIQRGDRVGIVGPNGAGKTTLLDLLTGRLAPDAGEVRLGANLEIAALEQSRASLDPDRTLAETLTGGGGDKVIVGGAPRHVVSYMGDFLFAPEQARTPLRVLSGGERARAMLARALARPSNLLLLDEPTNDLDLETLDVLEEMLGAYPGTVLLVSHDRDFLDRVATSVVAPEGDGRWTEFAGGYSDMLAQRRSDPARRGTGDGQARTKAGGSASRRERSRPDARRMSFRDKHALETLPGRLAELEGEVARLQAVLADAGLFARDRAAFDRATARLAAARAELAAAEEEWLRLELLKDELARGPE